MKDKRLYKKVRRYLLRCIGKGIWLPGQAIPSEFAIAAKTGVSQGTARRAIAELADEGILKRHQGRGTFVADAADPAVLQFPFFTDGSPTRFELDCGPCVVLRGVASPAERAALELKAGATVLRLYRLRQFKGSPVMSEAITLPTHIFQALKPAQATHAMYDLYQREFGVHVVRMTDRLSAVPADRKLAKQLGLDIGTPLLRLERVARAIDDSKVELRVNYCHSDNLHYLVRFG
ncbi:MAG: GntR family transcriptional regulator [Hyphomicrobiaceae bacterium]|nr:GntR family transcriptional regulator [Hyphomicrobiaceae bacterium]